MKGGGYFPDASASFLSTVVQCVACFLLLLVLLPFVLPFSFIKRPSKSQPALIGKSFRAGLIGGYQGAKGDAKSALPLRDFKAIPFSHLLPEDRPRERRHTPHLTLCDEIIGERNDIF